MNDSVLLAMQAPKGIPRSTEVSTTTDPLLPSNRTAEMLSHFFDKVYDTRPESHLSRLLKVVLGDPGAGRLRKRYTYAHLSQALLTTNFYDLDRFYSEVIGLRRFVRERLDYDPYSEPADSDEWEAVLAADASYRARIEQFSRAIPWAGTPTGMVIAASAILGVQCRVYEAYTFIDDDGAYAEEEAATANTYGDLEQFTYGELEGMTYAQMESASRYQGRLDTSRNEFIIRPLRAITDEEKYHLIRVMERLKPAEALMTIDTRGSSVHMRTPVFRVAADSTYWHIRSKVASSEDYADIYDRYDDGDPIEQPRYALNAYQGEAWSYNSDVVTALSYVENEDLTEHSRPNYERRIDRIDGTVIDYTPELALMDQTGVLMGRAVSDGILAAPVVERVRA